MRYFNYELPSVDDRQPSPCVEKQCVASTGKQSTVLLYTSPHRRRADSHILWVITVSNKSHERLTSCITA